MKILVKAKIRVVILVFFMLILLFNSFKFSTNSFTSKNQYLALKSSNYWTFSDRIYINNNWSVSKAMYEFISGSGTFNDPYVLENVTFKNIDNVNNIITIENSSDYFIIRNCKIDNSGTSINNKNILISNATKGLIENNTISSNMGTGISLIHSNNISVIENTLLNNSYIGIELNHSSYNHIFNNIASYQGKDTSYGYGINLYKSHNNSILQNTISYNSAIGILLGNSSNNNITLNSANHNYLGIRLTQTSNNNFVTQNNLKENTYCYIVDTDCEGNILEKNDCGPIGFEYYFFLIAFGIVLTLSLFGVIYFIRKRKKEKRERKLLR